MKLLRIIVLAACAAYGAVSYTHLDVYKRQQLCREIRARRLDGRRVEISQTRGATQLQPC